MTQSPRNLAAQNTQLKRDQEQLIKNLLRILDDLDRACEHWQQAEEHQVEMILQATYTRDPARSPRPQGILHKLKQLLWFWLRKLLGSPTIARRSPTPVTESPIEVVASAREGVEMIRRSLLDLLQQQQVVPIEVLGQPFDPATMYALGRQESIDTPENTVIQEVVRGYLWQNRILRESQVMVAVRPSSDAASE
jgi:molecular chaperone GrpE (heat shock protein)